MKSKQLLKIIQRKITGPHDAPEQVYRADRLITGSCAEFMRSIGPDYAFVTQQLCGRSGCIVRSLCGNYAVFAVMILSQNSSMVALTKSRKGFMISNIPAVRSSQSGAVKKSSGTGWQQE